MAYDRRTIRELTTASEFGLVEASFAPAVRTLSPHRLRTSIARARRLRDKHRDLRRRQRLAQRERTGTKQGAAQRTARKAAIFEETLARFTRRLEALEVRPARVKPARKTQPPKPAMHASRRKSGPAALLQKARTPRMKAMQAHVGSRGRRSQARRDSR
jgi:hypothetical protein